MTWDNLGCAIYSETIRAEERGHHTFNSATDEYISEKQLEKFNKFKEQSVSSNGPRGNIYARGPPRPQPKTNRRGWTSGYRFPANYNQKQMMSVIHSNQLKRAKEQQQARAQSQWDRMSGSQTARPQSSMGQNGPSQAQFNGNLTEGSSAPLRTQSAFGSRTARAAVRSRAGANPAGTPFFVYPPPATTAAYAQFAHAGKIPPHPPAHMTEGGKIAMSVGYDRGIPTGALSVEGFTGDSLKEKYRAYYEYLEAKDKAETAAREVALYNRPGEAALYMGKRRSVAVNPGFTKAY